MTNPGFAGLCIRATSRQVAVWKPSWQKTRSEWEERSRDRVLAVSLQRKQNVHRASEEEGIGQRDFCCESVCVCVPVRKTLRVGKTEGAGQSGQLQGDTS